MYVDNDEEEFWKYIRRIGYGMVFLVVLWMLFIMTAVGAIITLLWKYLLQ